MTLTAVPQQLASGGHSQRMRLQKKEDIGHVKYIKVHKNHASRTFL